MAAAPQVTDFATALANARYGGAEPTSILLGNGFSRALRDNAFSSESLFHVADFQGRLRDLFNTLATWDFEAVMRALDSTRTVLATCYPAVDIDAEFGPTFRAYEKGLLMP